MTSRRPFLGEVTRAPTPLYLPVSLLMVGLVTFAALFILMVGARSPYTHANLVAGYEPRYDRTEQIRVGEAGPYGGVHAAGAAPADPIERGERLFVTAGCASCHTLDARGGPVAPAIVGADEATITKKVRRGPGGMPRFASGTLSDADIAAIAAYLASLVRTDAGK